MREIEFRGKRADKKWLFGNLIEDGLNYTITPKDGGKYYDVDPKTIGQYTGLDDKNGVKIFEGDIVCYKTMNLPVRWDNEHSGFFIGKDKYWMMNDCDIEVIGNISDNPELLGGKE